MTDSNIEIDYDKVDPELILIKLNEVLAYLRKFKQKETI